MQILSLDIETACGVGCATKCDHALDEHRNRITVIGIYDGHTGSVFRSLDAFSAFLTDAGPAQFIGQNLKFDLKSLRAKGIELPSSVWEHDTLLAASALTEKIPESWLASYEARRKVLNDALPRGYAHRPGSKHSLKTLAPYFLGVEPFWEDPTNHDSDEYVLKDCEYTWRLSAALNEKLTQEGSYEFYKEKLLPWSRLLLDMECRGITLDLKELATSEQAAAALAVAAREKLDQLWAPAYAEAHRRARAELKEQYQRMFCTALTKPGGGKHPSKTVARYHALEDAAAAKLPSQMNLDSPKQLAWILRDYLQLDITDFDGEETTGKPVLKRLAETREDIASLLTYREQSKLVSAFFPSYRDMHWAGVLHTTFHPAQHQGDRGRGGTRTGRLSSSGPNLQQVPGHLHKLFVARPGHVLITKDASAIEPRLIAFYTQDKNLYDIIATGQDFHGYNAKIFFDLECEVADIKTRYPLERKMAKEVGLSLFYGAGANRLTQTAQKYGFSWGKTRAKRVLERFRRFYAEVYAFRDDYLNPHLMDGKSVPNLFGRQFRIENPDDVHMQGFNTLIQGSASDLIWNSAHRANHEFGARGIAAQPLLLVHDEVVVEAPEEHAAECERIIEHAMTDYALPTTHGSVKLSVEGKIADHWSK